LCDKTAKSLVQIAAEAHMSVSMLRRYRVGQTEPGMDKVRALAQALGVPVGVLFGEPDCRTSGGGVGEDACRYGPRIPIRAIASAADPQGRVAYLPGAERESLRVPDGLHAVRVAGDSMSPTFLEGQLVLVEDGEPENGDLAVIEVVGEDEALLKRVYLRGRDVIAESVNTDPRFEPMLIPRRLIRRMRRCWGAKF